MTDNFSTPFRMPESVPPTPELAAQLQKLAHTVSHPMRGAGLLLERMGAPVFSRRFQTRGSRGVLECRLLKSHGAPFIGILRNPGNA